jgi:hypothetical protein
MGSPTWHFLKKDPHPNTLPQALTITHKYFLFLQKIVFWLDLPFPIVVREAARDGFRLQKFKISAASYSIFEKRIHYFDELHDLIHPPAPL